MARAVGDTAAMAVAGIERHKVRVVPGRQRIARVERPEAVGREAGNAGATSAVAVGGDVACPKTFGGAQVARPLGRVVGSVAVGRLPKRVRATIAC